MSFNRTINYFKTIRAYVNCDICKEVIGIDIDKEEIRNGLKLGGLYIYKHRHLNMNPDINNPQDFSNIEHTTAVFINQDYEVKQVESYHGDSALAKEDLNEGTRIPVCEKEIQPMSVQLGMVTQEEYKILQLCDGDHTIETISEITGIPLKNLEEKIDSLRDKKIVQIIIRRT
ncbi:MAG: hypothetical protein JW776_04000 [Candidatus Lokiarchaeota archaeon]|nr:hypothetical protein [Candidatus Lokiarchaeota archaeon]